MGERGVRTGLWVATTVCLVAGLVAAVNVAPDQDRPGRATTAGGADAQAGGDTPAGSQNGTPASAPGDAANGDGDGSRSSGAGAGAAGGPSSNGGTANADARKPPPTPARVAPPRPGTYSFRVTEDGAPREVAIRVEDRGPSLTGGEAQLTLVTPRPGGEVRDELTWGSARVVVTKRTLEYPNYRGECDWDPDYLEMETNLAVGRQWKGEASCTITVFAAPTVATREGTAKVAEARRVHVAGADLDVWVIERTTRTSDGETTTQSASTQWFSPERGMVVKETSKTVTKPANTTTATEIEILSLDPTP